MREGIHARDERAGEGAGGGGEGPPTGDAEPAGDPGDYRGPFWGGEDGGPVVLAAWEGGEALGRLERRGDARLIARSDD